MCEYRARRYFLRARNQCVIYLGNTTIARGECKVGGVSANPISAYYYPFHVSETVVSKLEVSKTFFAMSKRKKRKWPYLVIT